MQIHVQAYTHHSIQWHNVFINSVLSNLFDGLRGTVLIKHGITDRQMNKSKHYKPATPFSGINTCIFI